MENRTAIVSSKNQKTAEKLFYYGLFGVVGLHYFYVGKSKQGRYHLILTFFLLLFTYAFCSSSVHTNTGELITLGEKISFTLKTWLPFMLAGIPTLIQIKTGTFKDIAGNPLQKQLHEPTCQLFELESQRYKAEAKLHKLDERHTRFDLDAFLAIDIASDQDPYIQIMIKAVYVVAYYGQCTTSILQKKLKLDYARAARVIDSLEQIGIVGPYQGANPRDVYLTIEQLTKQTEALDSVIEKIFDLYNFSELETEPKPLSESFCYDTMDGHEFETFCSKVLLNNGFNKVEITTGSGDFGTDILAEKDGITYAIQCKCYSTNVGIAAVQEANSGRDYYNAMVGVVMTNRYFTPQAKAQAEKSKILLWDRDRLNEMIGESQKITQ